MRSVSSHIIPVAGGDVQVELKLLEGMVLMKRLVTAPMALKVITGC